VFSALLLPVLFAKIAFECLLSPGSFERIGNWSECANTLVLSRVFQIQRQGAVATHAMASDANFAGVKLILERFEDGSGKLFRDVAVHLVVLGPRFGGSIDVEPGASAKIICVVFALDADATCSVSANSRYCYFVSLTWTCVGIKHSNPSLACAMLEEAFLRAVVCGTRQAGEVYQDWDFAVLGLRWEEEIEFALAAENGRVVSKLQQFPAKAGNGSLRGYSHFQDVRVQRNRFETE
jgi:hypothetical protein